MLLEKSGEIAPERMKKLGHSGNNAQLCPTPATPWTVTRQAPPSMGFSRQEYWSGLPFPSPGDLPNPGIAKGNLLKPISGGIISL